MAKRKGKKRAAVARKAAVRSDATEETDAQAKRTSAPRPRKGPRPSVEIVEIESDEEDVEVQPRLRGALRGLDPNAIIPPTLPSIEKEDEDDADGLKDTQSIQHGTRQARHGRSEVNYDMKFHPMDVVTRPKRAARRVSASVLPNDDAETEEESLPSSAQASDGSSEDEDDDSSDEEHEPVQRKPDPRATRHSKRATASTTVNYSMKNHPQDYALPGYKHKARKLKKKSKRSGRTLLHVAIPVTRDTHTATSETSDGDETMTSGELIDTEVPRKLQGKRRKSQKFSPRKKLRTLENDRDQCSSNRPGLQSTATETGSDMVHLLDNLAQSKTFYRTSVDVPTDIPMHNSEVDRQNTAAPTSEQSTTITTTRQDSYAHQDHVQESPKHSGEAENDAENSNDLPLPKFSAIRNEHNPDDATMFGYEDEGNMQRTETSWNSFSDSVANAPPTSNGVDSTFAKKDLHQDTEQDSKQGQSDSTDSMDLDRQNGHQSPPHPQHSHFEEQFAVTQIQNDIFDDLTTGVYHEDEPVPDPEDHHQDDIVHSETSIEDFVEMNSGERPDLTHENGRGSSTTQIVNSEAHVDDDPVLSDLKDFLKGDNAEANNRSDAVSGIVHGNSNAPVEDDAVVPESAAGSYDDDSDDGEETRITIVSSQRGTPEAKTILPQMPAQEADPSASAKRCKSAQYLTPESFRDSGIGSRRRSLDALIKGVPTHNVNDDDLLQSMRSSQHAHSDTMLRSDPAMVE